MSSEVKLKFCIHSKQLQQTCYLFLVSKKKYEGTFSIAGYYSYKNEFHRIIVYCMKDYGMTLSLKNIINYYNLQKMYEILSDCNDRDIGLNLELYLFMYDDAAYVCQQHVMQCT